MNFILRTSIFHPDLLIVPSIPVEKLILLLGFTGQAMFGARTVAQWIHSERAGKSTSPTIFWVLSTIGSLLFLTYGMIRADVVIILGQSISFYIYIRNLQLKGAWLLLSMWMRALVLLGPPLIIAAFLVWTDFNFDKLLLSTDLNFFLVLGIAGQLMLNLRYFYQWYFSEKAKESVLPLGFWIISAVASIFVVIYAIDRSDIVLFVAQAGGLVAYLRNIYLHVKQSATHG
jgi:lipid-A-disaccharide synthase-like uncharacterized protein